MVHGLKQKTYSSIDSLYQADIDTIYKAFMYIKT